MHSKIAYFPVSTFSLIPYIPEKVAGNYQSFKAVTLGVVAKEVGHLWTSFCSLKWANSPLNRIHTSSVFCFFFFWTSCLKTLIYISCPRCKRGGKNTLLHNGTKASTTEIQKYSTGTASLAQTPSIKQLNIYSLGFNIF